MRQPDYSGQFKRDVKQTQKRGKDMGKLKTLLTLLIEGKPVSYTHLQEAYSQMLAEDGVLIRREHDLSHITFRTEPDAARAERNRQLSDQLASILEKMAWLGGDIETFISEQNRLLADTFGADDAGGERKGCLLYTSRCV